MDLEMPVLFMLSDSHSVRFAVRSRIEVRAEGPNEQPSTGARNVLHVEHGISSVMPLLKNSRRLMCSLPTTQFDKFYHELYEGACLLCHQCLGVNYLTAGILREGNCNYFFLSQKFRKRNWRSFNE